MSACVDHMVKNRDKLLKRITRKVGSPEDAEDLFQDTVVKLLELEASPSDPERYVAVCLTHMIRDYEKRPVVVELTFDQIQEHQLEMSRDILEIMVEQETIQRLPKLINKLVRNPRHRELLHLIFVEGCSPEAAEAVCGITRTNRTTLVNRFVEKLGG